MPRREKQYVSCYVDGTMFGIDVLLVREINRPLDIVKIDLAPDAIVGLMNLRGQIVTVMDLGTRLGTRSSQMGEDARVIVLKTNRELELMLDGTLTQERTSNDTTGLHVDMVGDLVVADVDDVLPPPPSIGDVEGQNLGGVIKLADGLMALLKVNRVLACTSGG